MKNKDIGNKELPDFKELNDRLIARHTKGPTLVIGTNLDEQNATENNPYYNGSNEKEIKDYFEE